MKRQRVLIAVPSWGVSPPESQEYRTGFAWWLGKWEAQDDCPYNFTIGFMTDLIVQYSRERIAEWAVNEGFDWVCMIDDDMTGPIDIWDRLLKNNLDICAPLAFTRLKPHTPVVYAERGGWIQGQNSYVVENHTVLNYPKDQLFECDAVGFGAVCIKVDVLKRIRKPWFFTMFGSNGTGEDIFFCNRARQEANARVWCDARIKLGHLGPRVFVGEADFERENPHIRDIREYLGDWSQEKAKQGLMG